MADHAEGSIEFRALAARIRAATRELATLRRAVESGAPWPLSDNIGTAPEAHWGPPEVLAHVAEMLQYWAGEIERVLAGDDEPVKFGRVATNELRIGIIEQDRSLPPRELFARIESGAERLARRLEQLPSSDGARRGVHPTLGEFTAAGIAEAFVVGHLEDHVDQMRDVLGPG